jgi:DNA-binding MarR family transcriptional regulator
LSENEGVKGRRGPLHADVKDSLRELGIQLSLLNHRVSGRLDLRGVDLDCLNLIHRHGPISPSVLARRTGLHPATMTGVLDRLERNGWIERRRDPTDRRAVQVEALRDRNRELFGLLAGMNKAMEDILAQYDHAQLKLLADFLHQTTAAGQYATDDLAEDA